MATDNRPLSPHLQVYKLPLPAIMSITHRITGVGLAVGTLLLVYWLTAAAAGPDAYADAQAFIGSFIGRLLLFGWTVALMYHLCNGIRHLFWDAGHGLEIQAVHNSGLLVLVGTGVLTLIAWITAYVMMGN